MNTFKLLCTLLLTASVSSVEYDYSVSWYAPEGAVSDLSVCDSSNEKLKIMIQLNCEKCILHHGVDPAWNSDSSTDRRLCAGGAVCSTCPYYHPGWYCESTYGCQCRRRRLDGRELDASVEDKSFNEFKTEVTVDPGDLPFANCMRTACYDAINTIIGMSTTSSSCSELLVRLICSATAHPVE